MYALLCNLFAPTPQTLDELVSVLKGHYEPKPLVIIGEKFNFHQQQQSNCC